MKTLHILEKVGNSIIGSALLSPRMPEVEVGKAMPCIRTSEDIEGLLRCKFLDPTVPSEFNLLNSGLIQKILWKYFNQIVSSPNFLNPLDVIAGRPSIGYVPPECLTFPTEGATKALNKTGMIGAKISVLREQYPDADGKFWFSIAKERLYSKWIRELLYHLELLKGDLFAPPVAVINKKIASSVDLQLKINLAVSSRWEQICGRRHREIGLLYSFHLAPNALDEPTILREAVLGMNEILLKEDLRFWGVHLHFTDIRHVTRKPHRIDTAKSLVREVSQITRKYNGFTIISDAGPVGIAFLDLGASYSSYSPAMTPRKIYDKMRFSEEGRFGKVLGLWRYNLHGREDVRRRGDTMDETGFFPNVVPLTAQGEKSWRAYRVQFGKPYNISVMEKINMLRSTELIKNKNPNPGQTHIGRSSDQLITPWA